MKIPGLKTLKRGIKRIRSQLTGRALILGYHRIAEGEDDPYSLCVSASNFQDQLDVLQHEGQPVSLQSLVEGLRGRDIPKQAVVITFDDGYVDNLNHAKPLLDSFQIPATVFVSTGYLGGRFWWDELADLVLSPASDQEIVLEIMGDYSDSWNKPGPSWASSRDDRTAYLDRLYQAMLKAPASKRENYLHIVQAWKGAHDGFQSTARALHPEELVELSRGELIEIGAHTVSHPVLNALQEQELQYEILESKRAIETILGKPPVSFSCPHGSWSENIRSCLIDAGFNCALTSQNDAVSLHSDPYQLPRLWIGDWEKDKFAKQLRHWKGLLG